MMKSSDLKPDQSAALIDALTRQGKYLSRLVWRMEAKAGRRMIWSTRGYFERGTRSWRRWKLCSRCRKENAKPAWQRAMGKDQK
jgi:hypothetical protein